jgi:bestrophin-3
MVNKWQVVTIATYSFFIACVFGRQYTEDTIEEISIDLFFPSWTILELLVYIGLLKVTLFYKLIVVIIG